MKKFFSIAGAVVLVAGVFFFFLKGHKFAEKQMEEFVEANLNQPFHLEHIEKLPFVQEATLTLTKYEPEAARSLFRLVALEPETGRTATIEVPLASTITRGKHTHDGDSFGFAHIVTSPELAGLRGVLPQEITDESFRVEHFIGYDGSLRELYFFEPVSFKNEGLLFGGGQVRLDTSFFDRSDLNLQANIEKIQMEEGGNFIVLHPASLRFTLEKNGKYTGTSSPFFLEIDEGKGLVRLSQGTYSGQSRKVDGLNMSLESGQAGFDLMEIRTHAFDLALKNFALETGIHEADNNLFDIKWNVSAVPVLNSPSLFSENMNIKEVKLHYELKDLPAEVLNALQAVLLEEADKIRPAHEQLLRDTQKSDARLVFSSSLQEERGQAEIRGTAALNEYGKNLDLHAFLGVQSEKLFDMRADLRLDKAVADVFGITPLLQLQPQYIRQEEDVFFSAVELKDGIVKINGQALPL